MFLERKSHPIAVCPGQTVPSPVKKSSLGGIKAKRPVKKFNKGIFKRFLQYSGRLSRLHALEHGSVGEPVILEKKKKIQLKLFYFLFNHRLSEY